MDASTLYSKVINKNSFFELNEDVLLQITNDIINNIDNKDFNELDKTTLYILDENIRNLYSVNMRYSIIKDMERNIEMDKLEKYNIKLYEPVRKTTAELNNIKNELSLLEEKIEEEQIKNAFANALNCKITESKIYSELKKVKTKYNKITKTLEKLNKEYETKKKLCYIPFSPYTLCLEKLESAINIIQLCNNNKIIYEYNNYFENKKMRPLDYDIDYSKIDKELLLKHLRFRKVETELDISNDIPIIILTNDNKLNLTLIHNIDSRLELITKLQKIYQNKQIIDIKQYKEIQSKMENNSTNGLLVNRYDHITFDIITKKINKFNIPTYNILTYIIDIDINIKF
jgi:hypothetical protein